MFLVLVSGVFILMFLMTLAYMGTMRQEEDADRPTPEFTLESSYQKGNGFFIVNITDVDWTCGVTSGEFYLEHENGTQVPGEWGNVEDIYAQNMSYKSFNFSFDDKDLNGMMNPGDCFFIRSVEEGGPADEGYVFRLRHGVTGKTMGEVRLSK